MKTPGRLSPLRKALFSLIACCLFFGLLETLLWAVERPAGGKGFGFTGGHFHTNWQNDQFRRTILNALCWITGIEVPTHGVDSAAVSDSEIRENLDPKGKR